MNAFASDSIRTVLIIEDEEFIRLTVADHLKDAGHLVEEAECGRDGLRFFDPARHDAVILDLRLGDMDGHAILEQIRRKSAEIPVIIASGAGDMQDAIRALRAGASDFLTKPIRDFALLDHSLGLAWERLDLLRERRLHAQELERRVRERTSELAEANSRLQESEHLFRQLVENIPQIFWLHQLAPPRLLFVSDACERILGIPAKSLQADPELFFEHTHAEDRARMKDFLQSPSGIPQSGEAFRFVRPDGDTRWLHLKIFPVSPEGQPISRVAGITEDITERVVAEERDREQQRRLIEADKMISLGIMAAGVAHEINNPNHLLRLNAQALQRIQEMTEGARDSRDADSAADPLLSAMREEIPGLLRGIIGASDRIRDIVRRMKDFARPEDIDSSQAVDLEAVLRDALELLRNTLKNATDRLDVRIEEGLPRVRGSHQRLEQVLINLVVNAAEALEGKDRAIAISLHRKGRHLEITVFDEGRGIPEDIRRHVFDPFFTTKRDSGGLGLGLPISRTIVDSHGGTLDFETPPTGGTLARLLLPIMEAAS